MSSVCHRNILARLCYSLWVDTQSWIAMGESALSDGYTIIIPAIYRFGKNNLIPNPIYDSIQNNPIPGKPFYIYIYIYIRIHCLLINIILFICKKEYNKYIVVYRNF